MNILTSALFQSLFDLETTIEIRQAHKRSIKLPITLLFKAFGLKFSQYIEGSCLFKLYFVSR